jgi:DNA-binding response OmpR family regulator
MTTSTDLQILYVGRRPRLAEGLRALCEQRNAESRLTTLNRRPHLTFRTVSNQRLALQVIRTEPPGVVMVELEKKSESRVRFCEMVRYRLPNVAILAVAAAPTENSFAFDGLIQVPLAPQQVMSAFDQIQGVSTDYLLERGPLTLNIATRTVTTPKGDYTMTPKQCALLQMLMMHHNQVVSRSAIMQLIWETSYLADTRTLDVHIRWLRERIETDPSSPVYLETVRGVGYRLNLTQ